MPASLAADLLQFSQSLNNTVGDGTRGWTPDTVSSVCQWTGVQCYPANSSFTLYLSNKKISGKSESLSDASLKSSLSDQMTEKIDRHPEPNMV